jgi:hypothetical protein
MAARKGILELKASRSKRFIFPKAKPDKTGFAFLLAGKKEEGGSATSSWPL